MRIKSNVFKPIGLRKNFFAYFTKFSGQAESTVCIALQANTSVGNKRVHKTLV